MPSLHYDDREIVLDGSQEVFLQQGPNEIHGRRLRYRIPVEWLELTRMPADARTASSRASLEGEIALSPDGRPLAHTANLAVQMHGALVKSGVATAVPWRLESSRLTAQRTGPLERVVVSGL